MVMQTHIRTDKETLARLRTLAGDMPVSTYLREVVSKPGGEVPIDPIETLRISILKSIEGIKTELEAINRRIKLGFVGLNNEQNLNDAVYRYLATKDPNIEAILREYDASYDNDKYWEAIDRANDAEDKDYEGD